MAGCIKSPHQNQHGIRWCEGKQVQQWCSHGQSVRLQPRHPGCLHQLTKLQSWRGRAHCAGLPPRHCWPRLGTSSSCQPAALLAETQTVSAQMQQRVAFVGGQECVWVAVVVGGVSCYPGAALCFNAKLQPMIRLEQATARVPATRNPLPARTLPPTFLPSPDAVMVGPLAGVHTTV